MKSEYRNREIETRHSDSPYRLDLDVADNQGGVPIFDSVYAEDGTYHITPEVAAILARGFGRKCTSVDDAVNKNDASRLTYGAVMLLREEVRQVIDNARFLSEPLARMALFRQIKRERRVKQIIRTLLHEAEAIHGPCPKEVRATLWHQSVWKFAAKEIISEPAVTLNDGWATRSKWRWRYVKLIRPVGNKGTKLRKEYELWMKRRVRKIRQPATPASDANQEPKEPTE